MGRASGELCLPARNSRDVVDDAAPNDLTGTGLAQCAHTLGNPLEPPTPLDGTSKQEMSDMMLCRLRVPPPPSIARSIGCGGTVG
jgi:hypothetical protein